jgi:hypothetical protein
MHAYELPSELVPSFSAIAAPANHSTAAFAAGAAQQAQIPNFVELPVVDCARRNYDDGAWRT